MSVIGNKKVDFDFHIHALPGSPDSEQTVAEVVDTAIEAGLTTIAITDHNSIASLEEAILLCKEKNIDFICGIELSVSLEGLTPELNDEVIHVVGLGINPDINLFNTATNHIMEDKDRWFKEIKQACEKEFNVKLSAKYEGKMYKELADLGIFKERNEAKHFIKHFKINEIKPYKRLNISEVVDTIHNLGGIATLAHPNRGENHRVFNLEEIEIIVDYLVSKGLDGIELYHPNVVADDMVFKMVSGLVNKYDLLTSLGVDRHNSFTSYGSHYFAQDDFLTKSDIDFNAVKDKIKNRIR